MSVGVGLRVMAEMTESELTRGSAPSRPGFPSAPPAATRRCRGRWCWAGAECPSPRPGPATSTAQECSWRPTPPSRPMTCSPRWCWSACWPGWLPVATGRWPEPVGTAIETEAASTSRSSVSRRATASALEGLMSRDLSALAVAATMVDGESSPSTSCASSGASSWRSSTALRGAGRRRTHDDGAARPAGSRHRPDPGRMPGSDARSETEHLDRHRR